MKRTNILKVLLLTLALIVSIACFAACNEDTPAPLGNNRVPQWHQGEGVPMATLGAVGDYYYQSSTSDVWLRGDNAWSIVTNLGVTPPANDDNSNATPDAGGSNTNTPPGGAYPNPDTGTGDAIPNPDAGTTPPDSGDDNPGSADGNEGSGSVTPVEPDKIYIGYMGYIYQGATNTGILADKNLEYVYEDTTDIARPEAQEYFPGKYTDANKNVALMLHYDASAGTTFYSGSDIAEMTVYVKSATTVKIGTAKIKDIVESKKSGVSLTYTCKSYSLSAGFNTIEFVAPMNVHTDETIIISGAQLFYLDTLNTNDVYGDFCYLDGTASSDVISKTGTIKNTLAVSVKLVPGSNYRETPAVPGIVNDSNGAEVYKYEASVSGAPYAYTNLQDSFRGKRLTKIGIPVVKVAAIDDNQTFTFSVAKYNTAKKVGESINSGMTYTIKLPKDQLGSDPNNVKRWVYVDLSDMNITVSSQNALVFGKDGDTVVWGYGNAANNANQYLFVNKDTLWGVASSTTRGLFFDIHYKDCYSYEEHVAKYAEKTYDIADLKKAISGKNISILGDSISTFQGKSNGGAADTTNSTIRNNAYWYSSGSVDVKLSTATWWSQAISQSGMNLLVNNSWSGDQMYNNPDKNIVGRGLDRCVQLHDDTGSNAGTNPDIIAIFFGTNDRNRNVSKSEFRTLYSQMLDKTIAKYNKADIFVFTLLDTNDVDVTFDEAFEYNNIIRELAKEKGVNLVDLQYDSGITQYNYLDYTIDGVHPNSLGMDLITECFLHALYAKYVK